MANLVANLVNTNATSMCRSRHVYGGVLAVYHAPSGTQFVASAGELQPESRFFAASATKLIVTIVVMRMVEQHRFSLDDPMVRYLPSDLISGLHMMAGVDRTGEITIRHLISSHSGLRDYFSVKGSDGRSHMAALMAGEDSSWPLERTLDAVRGLPARFPPGAPGKIDYSDTNYQLVGRILETVTGKDLGTLFSEEVFAPLSLRDTYIYADPSDDGPAPIRAGKSIVHLPRYMTSISAEGGMVSTGNDMLQISRAFFAGRLFDIDSLLAQQNWRMLFWPGQFYFGLGLEKLWTPWFVSPLRPIRDVMGCWGQTAPLSRLVQPQPSVLDGQRGTRRDDVDMVGFDGHAVDGLDHPHGAVLAKDLRQPAFAGIEIEWLEDGNHDLKPRRKVSGLSASDHLDAMARAAEAWARRIIVA